MDCFYAAVHMRDDPALRGLPVVIGGRPEGRGVVAAVSIDEAYLDVTEHLGEWGTATRVAKEIRRRVREERGLTVSVGVGPNRLIAKIASDFHKPDGLTVVPPHKVQSFLDPLPVR